MQVKCPRCGQLIEWSAAHPWRPVCSERCKLIDLGAWFSGEHAVPGEPQAETPPEAPDQPERPH